ncbi:G-protein beta WD-40 repeat [Ostreococcus tauri]|uniref:G-protein beta WD-40 repeat n=1 Tax=Ostreococcus tauri TaxID=70448 RepID=Q013I4_OSTTA|nr:G-protein beta WD-40 repeat [Ostreococcus tauri]CAL54946.1 G-protein beta WD-40 repeat [Ostreococcus tauri]|eukprot:XP_003080778.1 G-protein beta WD-40 repeat [Ostreococcus tauri]
MTDVTTARARALAASALRNADVMFGADRALDRGGGSNWRARDGSDGSAEAARTSLRVKIANEYASVRTLARENELAGSKGEDGGRGRSGRGSAAAAEAPVKAERKRKKEPSDIASMIDSIDEQDVRDGGAGAGPSTALAPFRGEDAKKNLPVSIFGRHANANTGANIAKRLASEWPEPEWRAPWKLYRVISGHQGWVRSVAVDPENKWFVTGSADRTIKVWDLASGGLKLTLTGHIEQVTGLVVSPRHPYMFSCGLDKKVKCWDLEYNKVIRNYHGHLSGVYSIAMHPTLDLLFTGGRDSACRVWDIRTKQQVYCLTGHDNTVGSILAQDENPQLVTGSYDGTIRMWDLAMGKSINTLTHHKKGVRAMVMHKKEFAFVSASADNIKKFSCHGDFMHNMLSQQKAIVNTLSMNDDDVIFSGGDNGSMCFWDYKSGHCFQQEKALVQPGSLEAECGIYASTFDLTGSRLITCEADKTIKMWKEDVNATPESNPILPFEPPKNVRRGGG